MMYTPISELWSKFTEMPRDRESMVATNDLTGYSIYMSDDGDGLVLTVCDETGDPINVYQAWTPEDAQCKYAEALRDIGDEPDYDEYEDDPDEMRELIKKHEDFLDELTAEYVYALLEDNGDSMPESDIENAARTIKEVACEILARQYKAPLYRPMELVRSDGSHFFTDYPYPFLDNPDTN